jgi:hypothetical protein
MRQDEEKREGKEKVKEKDKGKDDKKDKPSSSGKNGEDKESLVIKFGKYRGENLIGVLKKDKKYILWLSENVKNEDLKAECKKLLMECQPNKQNVIIPKPKLH